jgi:serine/threonine protein kinase
MAIMNVSNYTFIADQDLLGQGQYGRVYRAHNTQNHRELCALKLVQRSTSYDQEKM